MTRRPAGSEAGEPAEEISAEVCATAGWERATDTATSLQARTRPQRRNAETARSAQRRKWNVQTTSDEMKPPRCPNEARRRGRLFRPRRTNNRFVLVGLLTRELRTSSAFSPSNSVGFKTQSRRQWRKRTRTYSVRIQRRGRSGIAPDSLFAEPQHLVLLGHQHHMGRYASGNAMECQRFLNRRILRGFNSHQAPTCITRRRTSHRRCGLWRCRRCRR